MWIEISAVIIAVGIFSMAVRYYIKKQRKAKADEIIKTVQALFEVR